MSPCPNIEHLPTKLAPKLQNNNKNMEELTFTPDNFNIRHSGSNIVPIDLMTRGLSPESAPKIIQHFIIRHLDDNNIELITCDASAASQLEGGTAPSQHTPNWEFYENVKPAQENFIRSSQQELGVHKSPSPIPKAPASLKTPTRERPILSKPERAIMDVTIYSCFKCSDQFNSLASFRQHLKWHKIEKNFNCQCGVGFNIENNLKIHMVMNHPGKSDVCPICFIGFQRKASLKSHIMIHQVEELFLCEECHGEYQSDEELLKHMESHATTKVTKSLSKSLICPYCKLDYETVAEYKQHIAKHVEVKKNVLKGKKVRKRRVKERKKGNFKCKYCNKSFSKGCLLNRHERIHTGEKPYKCQFCDRAFAQKGTLQIHLDKHTGLKPYSCTLCSAKFSQKGNLRAHVEKTHTAPKGSHKAYKCSQCACIFRKIATLNGHMTKVHLNQPEEESLDSNNFIDKVMDSLRELHSELGKSALKQPDKEPKPEPTAPVSIAGMGVVKLAEDRANGGLKRYTVRQKKIGDVRWYFCNYCSRRFKKPSDLIRHFRTHTMEKPFECSMCNQSFSLKSTLVNHYKMHEKLGCPCDDCDHTKKNEKANVPNYVCLLCERTFATFEEAKKHRPEHEGEIQSTQNIIEPLLKQPLYQTAYGSLPLKAPKPKIPNTGAESPLERPHHCKICDARFSRLMSLKRHMAHHTGERKFKCNICPKAFVTKYRLKEHLNFHKNVKNFGCSTCGKKFVTSSLLKRHNIVHNTHRPYTCPYCDKAFKTLLLSRSHIRNVHKTAPVEVSRTETALKDIPSTIEKNVENPPNVSVIECAEPQPLETNHQTLQPDYQMVYLNIDSQAILNQDNLISSIKLPNDSYLFNDLEDAPSMIFSIDAAKTDMVDPNDVIQSLSGSQSLVATPLCADSQRPDAKLESASLPVISTVTSLACEEQNVPVQVDFESLPISIIDTSSETAIPYDAQVICINCHKMFSNYYVFERHACSDEPPTQQPSDGLNLLIGEDELHRKVYPSSTESLLTVQSDDNAPKSEFYENRTLATSPGRNASLDLDKMKRFTYKKPLLADVRELARPRQFVCKHCNFVTSFDDRFRKHLLVHPDLSDKICKFCLKDFKKLSDLKRHLRTHTGEKPFECERCHKKFTLKSTLESHMRTHDVAGVTRITCDVCNSNFTSKSSLKVHMLLHTGARPHACSFCEQTFRTSAIRKAHEKNIHLSKGRAAAGKAKLGGSKIVQAVAEEVAESVRNETRIPSEISSMSEPMEGTIVINPAPSDSATESMFFLQQIDDSGIIIAPVPINLGDIALLDVANLDDAIRRSVEVKKPPSTNDQSGQVKQPRVECDICHKLYSSKDVLRKHKRTLHGQNRKFPCIKCDKGYDQLEELHKHIVKLHTGYRPYACQYCANSFSEENSLKTHIKRIHQKSLAGQETTNALLGLQYDLSCGDSFL